MARRTVKDSALAATRSRPSGSPAAMYQDFRLHQELFQDKFDPAWLHDDFVKIMQACETADEEDKETMVAPNINELKEELDGVYSFNVFSEDFVQKFKQEIENFYGISARENIPVRRPNGMNNYGVVVNEIGMRPLITSFQQNYLWPLCRRLYPVQASQFDDHHAFIVRYNAQEDLGLDMHIDDSDVTFNVCLGDNFTGATLTFCGLFGAPDHRHYNHTYHHKVGRAVLHLGARRHGADDIESGKRANLVIWNHNWEYRANGGNQAMQYFQEDGPPSEVCLSYTHDRDFTHFKKLPLQAQNMLLSPWCPPRRAEYDGFKYVKKPRSKKEEPY